MADVFLIPLRPAQAQKLSADLGGTTYQLQLTWCVPSESWTLDLLSAEGVAIINGIPLVCGADLLAQYAYLGISGSLYALTEGSETTPPTFDNLGEGGNLYYMASQ